MSNRQVSNRTYELVVLLDADAPTDTRSKIVADAQTMIAQHGEVKAKKEWGTRQLPYLIDHHEEAEYHVFQFETKPESIAQLDRALKLTEGILRFRIYETETGKELIGNPPLFKREEREYERPPRNANATPRSGDAVAEAPAEKPAEAPAETPAEETPAVEAAVPEAAAAEAPAVEAPAVEAPAEDAATE